MQSHCLRLALAKAEEGQSQQLISRSVGGEHVVEFYDVTMPIHEAMPVYKNREENRPRLTVVRDFPDGARETNLALYLHAGTHVDAPFHFLPEGNKIDTLPIEEVVRPCRVLDMTDVVDKITPEDLASKGIQMGEFILLKTRNSFTDDFDPEYVFLDRLGAEYLVKLGVQGVGIDAFSIERAQQGHPTHRLLLRENIVIIEGLRLGNVPPGDYLLLALPLPIVGAEASPSRVILVKGRLEVS